MFSGLSSNPSDFSKIKIAKTNDTIGSLTPFGIEINEIGHSNSLSNQKINDCLLNVLGSLSMYFYLEICSVYFRSNKILTFHKRSLYQ